MDSQTCGLFGWVGAERRKMDIPERGGLVWDRWKDWGVVTGVDNEIPPSLQRTNLEITHHGSTAVTVKVVKLTMEGLLMNANFGHDMVIPILKSERVLTVCLRPSQDENY